MTPTELARARALCEAATPGRWLYQQAGVCGTGSTWLLLSSQTMGVCSKRPVARGLSDADAEFIAASRQLVPALLDALALARAALERIRFELSPSRRGSIERCRTIAAASLASRAGDGEQPKESDHA